MSGRQRFGSTGAAVYLGLTQSTWSAYVTRGTAPPPDGFDEGFRQNYWLKSTLDRWQESRPGHGGRPATKRA